jgi:hypothetical protein
MLPYKLRKTPSTTCPGNTTWHVVDTATGKVMASLTGHNPIRPPQAIMRYIGVLNTRAVLDEQD